jgi:hypothetical protein
MIPQLRRLLEEGVYQPAPAPVPLGSMDFPQAERRSSARIIMTAAQRIPAFDGLTTVIQVRRRCCCCCCCGYWLDCCEAATPALGACGAKKTA